MGEIQVSKVLAQYGLPPGETVPLHGIYLVKTGGRKYALKEITTALNKTRYTLYAMEYLWHRGFKNMARLIKSEQGELLITQEDKAYFLTEWIEGRYIDFHKPAQSQRAVHMLARMHKLGEGFNPPSDCTAKNDIGKWPQKWTTRLEELSAMAELAREGQNTFDRVFLKDFPRIIKQATRACAILQENNYSDYCSYLSNLRPLCHRDFVYHNIVYRQNSSYLIDFEYAVQDSRLVDLARVVRTWTKFPRTRDSLSLVFTYHHTYPLSDTEQKLLSALILFPHNYWRLASRWYYSGQRDKNILLGLQHDIRHREAVEELIVKLARGFRELREMK